VFRTAYIPWRAPHPPKTGRQRSLREIAAETVALGHLNVNGKPFSAKSVRPRVLLSLPRKIEVATD